MALLASEVARLKAELGYNVLTVGALPYIGHSELFDQVVVPYMQAGASTTSTTAVTAASTPTAVTLTLASATGFAASARVVVDVDDLQEMATIRAVSGSTITVVITLAHSGTYPVTVEGGESIVREKLTTLRTLQQAYVDAASTAGIQRVDDIWFYGTQQGSQFATLLRQRSDARDELASILGVANMFKLRQAASQQSTLY